MGYTSLLSLAMLSKTLSVCPEVGHVSPENLTIQLSFPHFICVLYLTYYLLSGSDTIRYRVLLLSCSEHQEEMASAYQLDDLAI